MLVLFVSFSFDPIAAEIVNQINQNYGFVFTKILREDLINAKNVIFLVPVVSHTLFFRRFYKSVKQSIFHFPLLNLRIATWSPANCEISDNEKSPSNFRDFAWDQRP